MSQKVFKEKGHTLLEVVMSVIIFSLIMVTITSLLNIGLKSWQIGEASTDSQNAAQVTVQRLKSDLSFSCKGSCNFGTDLNGDTYLAFETAFSQTGTFKLDTITRTPLWQAYIVYYTHKEKPSDKFRILYRKRIDHNICSVAKKPLLPPNIPFDIDLNVTGQSKIMAKSVEKFEVTENVDLIKIHLICTRNIGERKLPYEQDFNADNIKTSIELFTSIYPRNN